MTPKNAETMLADHRAWLAGRVGQRPDMSEANLNGADLSHANLSHADLSHADLSHADLSHANLNRANMYKAYLYKADLSHANLNYANLYNANLSHADLSHADLSHANLCNADMSHANLSGADLNRANLYGADLRRADLYKADLNYANLYNANLYGNPDTARWQHLGLMPEDDQGRALVWKHVTSQLSGNLGYPYKIGESYECACMVCAGPFGALVGHNKEGGWAKNCADPHVLAIRCDKGALYDYDASRGIYNAFRGTPVAAYRAAETGDGEYEFMRIAGDEDPLALIKDTQP